MPRDRAAVRWARTYLVWIHGRVLERRLEGVRSQHPCFLGVRSQRSFEHLEQVREGRGDKLGSEAWRCIPRHVVARGLDKHLWCCVVERLLKGVCMLTTGE